MYKIISNTSNIILVRKLNVQKKEQLNDNLSINPDLFPIYIWNEPLTRLQIRYP